jgi:threonine/homoserine/homoserine lactone efflux protein
VGFVVFAGPSWLSAGPPATPSFARGTCHFHELSVILLTIYSMLMAAVFAFTTVALARHTQILSRWLTIAERVIGLVLTVTARHPPLDRAAVPQHGSWR